MNQHYLKALSIEVLLASAGFNAKHWDAYVVPRGRGGSLYDPHVKALVEFFFPDLFNMWHRAVSAFEGNPVVRGDFPSETNTRFLSNLIHIVFFWFQDAVSLLDKYPDLKNQQPWRHFLEDPEARNHFTQLASQVRLPISEG